MIEYLPSMYSISSITIITPPKKTYYDKIQSVTLREQALGEGNQYWKTFLEDTRKCRQREGIETEIGVRGMILNLFPLGRN